MIISPRLYELIKGMSILKIKMNKINQESLKLEEVKKLAITRKKKRDLRKATVKEFLEEDFKDHTDSDIYNSDEKDKNIGMILYIRISLLY